MNSRDWFYLERQRQSWIERDNRFTQEYENEPYYDDSRETCEDSKDCDIKHLQSIAGQDYTKGLIK